MGVFGMNLGELIEWLEKQDPDTVVKDGFGTPHSDRGDYSELAFKPVEKTTFGEMLKNARAADGATFYGWKGGEFEMGEWTPVHIGEYGECGVDITEAHFKNWLNQNSLDKVYHERNQLVAALTKVFPSYISKHPQDEEWEDDWRFIVFIRLPTGQVSWHIHDSEVDMFTHLAVRPNDWDGHTTEEKYDRLARLIQTWEW